MIFGILKSNKKRAHQYWTACESGYEKTDSASIINHLLLHLKTNRTPLALVKVGYQSAPTILFDIVDNKILIDKPVDWPDSTKGKAGNDNKIRVVFKDNAKKWNHFNAIVTSQSKDTLRLSYPKVLYRLERREYYRIHAPGGSHLSFRCNQNRYDKGILNDFSAGGMLFSMAGTTKITDSIIEDINISLPGADDIRKYINVDRGEVIRAIPDRQSELVSFGVSFQVSEKEKEELLKMIRQHELAQLQRQKKHDT